MIYALLLLLIPVFFLLASIPIVRSEAFPVASVMKRERPAGWLASRFPMARHAGRAKLLWMTWQALQLSERLDRPRRMSCAEASLHGFTHQIPDHLSADVAAASLPSHDLPITSVESKGHAQTSPLQQATSNVSEVQRRLGRIVMIRPSCTRPGALPV